MTLSPQRPSIWPLITAVGVGITLAGVVIDTDTAARASMIVIGGVLLGTVIGWLSEERLTDAPAATSVLWLLFAAIGVGVVVSGVIADADSVARLAAIVVGGAVLGSSIGWLLADMLSPSVSIAPVLASPSGPPWPYAPPTDVTRSEARQALYHKALQDIVSSRFGFPTPQYSDYMTHVNDPRRSIGIQMPNGSVAYPDIVVVQHPENNTEIVAEVETSETVGEEAARHEWLPYAHLAPLYLYVPVGKGDEAQALCRRFRVPVVGIRTWRYVVGYEGIEINDHYTVPSGPEDLLPKILRPARSQ